MANERGAYPYIEARKADASSICETLFSLERAIFPESAETRFPVLRKYRPPKVGIPVLALFPHSRKNQRCVPVTRSASTPHSSRNLSESNALAEEGGYRSAEDKMSQDCQRIVTLL